MSTIKREQYLEQKRKLYGNYAIDEAFKLSSRHNCPIVSYMSDLGPGFVRPNTFKEMLQDFDNIELILVAYPSGQYELGVI